MKSPPLDDLQQLEAHLKDVYERNVSHLARYLEFLLGDEEDAWEVTQEAFIRYVAFLKRGGKPKSPLQLLKKIASRLALRLLRRSRWKTQQSILLTVPEPGSETPAEVLYNLEVLRTIWDGLDPRGKVVAQAWMVDEMTESEIAKYTGIPRSSVQRRIKQIQSLAKRKGAQQPVFGKKGGQNGRLDASNRIEGPGEQHEDPGDRNER